jgi:hypothetical protein
MPFPASLGVSHLQAPSTSPSSVDPKAGFVNSSLELSALQHSRIREPFFFIPFQGRPGGVALPSRKTHPRVWLPSR